ncbi:GNAT family N-acetyltransferase [Halobacillus faecis]
MSISWKKPQAINQKEPAIKQEYITFKVTKDVFDNQDHYLENIGFLHSKILEFWPSPMEFFQKGTGYGILYQNKIVSLCFSGFVAGHVHGLDIETIEEHQGNKLGQKAAHWVVKECERKGWIPYWDCEASNTPSNKIAENVGLELYLKYNVYIFPIDAS